jgi:uncharacterized membrane-anchored protein YitT (DUF2179 family)
VFGAKTAADLLITFAGTILLLVALGLVLVPAALLRGATEGVDWAWPSSQPAWCSPAGM